MPIRPCQSHLPQQNEYRTPLLLLLECPHCPSRHFTTKTALRNHWNAKHQAVFGCLPASENTSPVNNASPVNTEAPLLFDQAAYEGLQDALGSFSSGSEEDIIQNLGSDVSDQDSGHPVNPGWTQRRHPIINGVYIHK
jgi:hypothetical protein